MSNDDFGNQMLGLLVSFAHQLDDAGILDEAASPAAAPEDPAVPQVAAPKAPCQGDLPVPGACAKASGPPLPAHAAFGLPVQDQQGSSSSSSSSRMAKTLTPPESKFAPGIPPAPSEAGISTKGRLVCTPDQMKKFLYGAGPKPKTAAAASTPSDTLMSIICFMFIYVLAFALAIYLYMDIMHYSLIVQKFSLEFHSKSIHECIVYGQVQSMSFFQLRTRNGHHLSKELAGFEKLEVW